ncbi:MAG: ATP-binding cassette domain-containing protein, partial [Actinobacteria bacterium]|nr:ATP-binding cassette domain-containing protein [Actinomycetota bacterium]
MSAARVPVIELKAVEKSFGAVEVLSGVNFVAMAGEVTALVGDNGAGKSTLIKGIAGVQSYDSGTILFEGKEVSIKSPVDASSLGIEVVYQDLALCDNLDIVQNMFLGREMVRSISLDDETMEQKAASTLKGLSVRTISSVRQKVSSLSGGQR